MADTPQKTQVVTPEKTPSFDTTDSTVGTSCGAPLFAIGKKTVKTSFNESNCADKAKTHLTIGGVLGASLIALGIWVVPLFVSDRRKLSDDKPVL